MGLNSHCHIIKLGQFPKHLLIYIVAQTLNYLKYSHPSQVVLSQSKHSES